MSLPAFRSRRRPSIGAATISLLGSMALAFGPTQARAEAGRTSAEDAAVGTAGPPEKPNRAQIQQLHEGCQRQLDEGRAVEAAQCLAQVYDGLVALDGMATVDLYYVLSDAVASLEAAGKDDPRELCQAARLIEDYRKREVRFAARRYAGKVVALQKKTREALESARAPNGRDVCAEEPPTSVEVAAPGDGAVTPGGEVAEAAETSLPGTPIPEVRGRVTATRPTTQVQRMTPRRRLFAPRLPYTALLDASFGVTLAGVAGAGVGAALYIYGLECKDGPPRCSGVAPTGVRDAGLVLMSAGAVTMIVGFALRFADHRAARKALRDMPRPVAGPTSVGLTWARRF